MSDGHKISNGAFPCDGKCQTVTKNPMMSFLVMENVRRLVAKCQRVGFIFWKMSDGHKNPIVSFLVVENVRQSVAKCQRVGFYLLENVRRSQQIQW